MPKHQSNVRERSRTDIDEPRSYKVICYNDDFTTFEFVVKVLMTVFFKSQFEAERLTIEVDQKKSAVVGVYSYDVATSKVEKAVKMARAEGFPLRFSCEPIN